jgi:hypothetical protein
LKRLRALFIWWILLSLPISILVARLLKNSGESVPTLAKTPQSVPQDPAKARSRAKPTRKAS